MLKVVVVFNWRQFPLFFFQASWQGVESVGLGQDCFLASQFLLSSLQCFLCHCEFDLATSLVSTDPFLYLMRWFSAQSLPSQSSRHLSTIVPLCRSLCWLLRPKARQSFPDWLVIECPSSEINAIIIRGSEDHQLSVTSLCCSSTAVSMWSCWWILELLKRQDSGIIYYRF